MATDNQSTDFRETLYTVDKHGHRRWVYPNLIKGRFFRTRGLVTYPLMIFYLAMPWITIAGEQAIFLDIPARRFVILGAVFWASDTTFLVLLLGALAISLFFFTALFGRVWCGWACPETVFLEFLFRPIERLIEGSAAQRAKLDAQPWDVEKTVKKLLKLSIFTVLSWIIANTFVAYFVGSKRLLEMMQQSPIDNPVPFLFMASIVGLMLFQFGWFREQFCTVLCPYARFQSVLMDANSLTVGYDLVRGEPRGKLERDQAQRTDGDCIDCKLCVRVCPTGIDIRNGLQLECIACAACIDACDSVMEHIGRPLGLIRYATENQFKGDTSRWLRPRVVVYGLILIIYSAVFGYRLTTRSLVEVQIVRAVGDNPFTILADGKIQNHFTLHLSNKGSTPQRFAIKAPDEVRLTMPLNPFPVEGNQIAPVPVFLSFPKTLLDEGKKRIEITATADDGSLVTEQITLLGPDEENIDEED